MVKRAQIALELRCPVGVGSEHIKHQIMIVEIIGRIQEPKIKVSFSLLDLSIEGIADRAPSSKNERAIGQLDMTKRPLPQISVPAPFRRMNAANLQVIKINVEVMPVR